MLQPARALPQEVRHGAIRGSQRPNEPDNVQFKIRPTASWQTAVSRMPTGEDIMLHLNAIFEAEGLKPNRIQLIRHKDQRFQKEGKSVFDVWCSERERFEKY